MRTFFVSTDLNQTASIIKGEMSHALSGTVVDEHIVETPSGAFGVLVFEKYFYRARNRVSLTVTIDNFRDGDTRVHTCPAGGSQGVFLRFDWGASERFEDSVYYALRMYERY